MKVSWGRLFRINMHSLPSKFERSSLVKLPEFSSGIQTKDNVFVIGLIIRKEDGFLEQRKSFAFMEKRSPKITRDGRFAYE